MKTKKYDLITITFITIICSIAYISLCFNTNVWMDEAFTATLAHNSFSDVLLLSMQDTLPPLYNIILKITTTVFGYHIPVMKLTSVVPMILTMIIGATTVRKRFGIITAAVFNLCIAGMPLMFYYGVEIRMYSLGFFFATASGIFAYEVVQDSNIKNWVLFTIFSTLAGYSHHFAFVAVGFVYLFLLIYYFFCDRANIRRWFKCLGFTFLLYLPCMIVTLKQFANVSGYFSMPDIDLRMFIQYVTYPYMVGKITASVLCLLVVLILLAVVFMRLLKKQFVSDDIYSIACFCVYYGVLLFGTVISKIMTANIFVDRYLFFSTGLLWLFVAIQIGKLPKKLPYIGIIAIAYIGMCSYIVQFNTEYRNSADEEIAFLRENVSYGDIFYAIGGHEELECCIPFLSIIANESAPLTYVAPMDIALSALDMYDGMNLWVAVLDGYESTPEDIAALSQHGYELTYVSDFDFDRYKCSMYKATHIN